MISWKKNGIEVKLVNSPKTKAIASAKIKTDAIDSRTLPELLMADLVPPILTIVPKWQVIQEHATARR